MKFGKTDVRCGFEGNLLTLRRNPHKIHKFPKTLAFSKNSGNLGKYPSIPKQSLEGTRSHGYRIGTEGGNHRKRDWPMSPPPPEIPP
jgi:hypothetical protein